MKPASKYILYHNALLFLLFSAMGTFLCALVIYYGEHLTGRDILPDSVHTYVATILVVNFWGFSLLAIHSHFSKSPLLFYTKRRKLLNQYYLIALMMLAFNYLSFVFIRWLFSRQTPFLLSLGGATLLYSVWFIETIVVSLIFIEYATRNAIALYKEQHQLKKDVEIAQYKAMQSQLDPHFLFNSLSVLIAEIEYNPRNAVLFTQNLSEIYRYILRQQDKMRIELQEELNFFDAYIFLFRIRLEKCFRIENNIPQTAFGAYVPPLTLQLLIENVFKHNYMSEENPIDINLDIIDSGKRLRISNTLRPRRNNGEQSGLGLENLSKRVQILCRRSIKVCRDDECFTVIIPLLYE